MTSEKIEAVEQMRLVEQQIVQCEVRQAVPTFLQRGHQQDPRDDRNTQLSSFQQSSPYSSLNCFLGLVYEAQYLLSLPLLVSIKTTHNKQAAPS